jgi:hypothetical protein
VGKYMAQDAWHNVVFNSRELETTYMSSSKELVRKIALEMVLPFKGII